VKTIALVARAQKPEALEVAKELKAARPDLEFLVDETLGTQLDWPFVADEELAARADLMVVLGGDGTLIRASRLLKGRAVPIMGVNLGSLGFMTEIPVSEAVATFKAVLAGEARIDSRMKLAVRLYREGRAILEDEVLNDVVVNKSALARIADFETFFDGAFVATFKADGVIFSTPTGSTAYSLSAGGPIVHPRVDCVIVTPICPHALTQRPIVVPGDQVLSSTLTGDVTDVYLTIDGRAGQPLYQGDRVEVRRSDNRVMLVRNTQLDYFGVLRQKLRWGER